MTNLNTVLIFICYFSLFCNLFTYQFFEFYVSHIVPVIRDHKSNLENVVSIIKSEYNFLRRRNVDISIAWSTINLRSGDSKISNTVIILWLIQLSIFSVFVVDTLFMSTCSPAFHRYLKAAPLWFSKYVSVMEKSASSRSNVSHIIYSFRLYRVSFVWLSNQYCHWTFNNNSSILSVSFQREFRWILFFIRDWKVFIFSRIMFLFHLLWQPTHRKLSIRMNRSLP